jgi:hypothetical protein
MASQIAPLATGTSPDDKKLIGTNPDDEKLIGAEEIRQALNPNLTLSQIFYGLEKGLIPADKYGRKWITTRKRLRALGAG